MNLSNIPEQGMIYALYRERVVYQPYKKEDQELEKLLDRGGKSTGTPSF